MANWYQHLPEFVDPIAVSIGSFDVRWYSVMYIVGLAVVYMLLSWRIGKGEGVGVLALGIVASGHATENEKVHNNAFLKDTARNQMTDVLVWAFSGALIGGRFGYVLMYDARYYLENPLAIISPYGSGGAYTGIFGMSFFGGLVGALCAGYVYACIKKKSFLALADFIVPAIPLGYFFGRIGNFLNGELYGKITGFGWGMYFPMAGDGRLRHPSQLYEALGEGLILFIILWTCRNRKVPFAGYFMTLFIFGYSALRFVAEFWREVQSMDHFAGGFLSKGQVLAACMMAACLIFWAIKSRKKSAN